MKELISVVLGGIIIYLFKLYFDKDRIKKIKVNIRNYIFEGKRVTLEKSIDAFALKNSEMYEDWFRAYFSFDLSLPFNSYVNSFEINFVLDGYKLNKGSFQSVVLCYKDRGGYPFLVLIIRMVQHVRFIFQQKIHINLNLVAMFYLFAG